jgi:DNA-binding MarR family transcriptional regulator
VTKDRSPDDAAPWSHDQGVHNSLGFSLSQLGLETARQFSVVVGEFGLEPRDFAVLFAISTVSDQTQQVVGESLSIPASSMVAIVDRLESGGLVERRSRAGDRRAKSLRVTPRGRRVLNNALTAAADQEAKIGRGITSTERATLLSLLRRISANLGVAPAALPDRGSGERPAF